MDKDCIIWTGKLTRGYGYFYRNGKIRLVHRESYINHYGKIPDGLQVDHLCRNRSCYNPSHLEAVTLKENVLRGISPSALNALKTSCPSGHEYTAENTHVDKANKRTCRSCNRARGRLNYKKKKALLMKA